MISTTADLAFLILRLLVSSLFSFFFSIFLSFSFRTFLAILPSIKMLLPSVFVSIKKILTHPVNFNTVLHTLEEQKRTNGERRTI